ncbi:MAG: peptidylprolyl isomerase [Gemmatimonadota bacterium]
MRTIPIFVALLALAAPLNAQVEPLASNGGLELVDRVVAVVGDTTLLQSDVQAQLNQMQASGQLPDDPIAREQVAQEVMQARVDELILIEAARDAELSVPDDAVIQQVDQQLQEVQDRFGSAVAFETALAESGLTRSRYRQTLIEQGRDQQMSQEFLRMRLANRTRPLIDEDEIEAFFEERRESLGERPATVSFEQVVIAPKPSEEARAAAIATGEEVLQELAGGADFEVLARRFSNDEGTAEHGGDLGWFRPGRMVAEFEQVAFSLRPGQTSGLVETDFGFHIIRVERARGAERQARHILIRAEVTERDIQIARERADSVVQAVQEGASLTELAARYNDTDDMRTVSRTALDGLPPGYAGSLAEAAEGELVGPIELPDPRGNRWAVIRLTERTSAGQYTLDDVRDLIRQNLQEQKMREQLLEELRQQIYVNVLI